MNRFEPFQNLLLIAAREPAPGQTKTRLGAEIGMNRAAALYEAFLCDLAARLIRIDRGYRPGWAFSPPNCDFTGVMARIGGVEATSGARFVSQCGADWGERQVNLLRWGLEQGYRRIVLTASDSPQLSLDTIGAAFAALDDADVVLGPVFDGGYYLIGVRDGFDVLSGVPMSTSRAADSIRINAERQGLRLVELMPTFDVDVIDDLNYLRMALVENPALAPATARALTSLGLWLPFLGSQHDLPVLLQV
jgi:glycosyltransferase A (GT-A) superfamily protein (DUF2064 family)